MLSELWYFTPLLTFTLVLSRVSGLVMTAPLLASSDVPLQVRGFFTVAVAVLLTPMLLGTLHQFPTTIVDLGILVFHELVLGMIFGVGIAILLAGVQITGQILSQLSGMSLADVFNPGFDEQIPLLSHLLYLVTVAIFTILDGHRRLIDALLQSFNSVPIGTARYPSGIAETLVNILAESFSLGMRAAAPAMVALLLATLLLGLIGKTLPQLNVMVVGFSVNSLITLGLLSIGIGGMVYLFRDALDPALILLNETIQAKPPSG